MISGGEGAYFRPTWSPDGSTLAWQQGDDIYSMPVNLDTCVGQSEFVTRGAAPDWGPASRRPGPHRDGTQPDPARGVPEGG